MASSMSSRSESLHLLRSEREEELIGLEQRQRSVNDEDDDHVDDDEYEESLSSSKKRMSQEKVPCSCTWSKCRRPYLIEPVVFCVVLAYGAYLTVNPQYIYHRLVIESSLRKFILNPSAENGYGRSPCATNKSEDVAELALELESQAGFWSMGCIIALLLPPIILSNSIIPYTQRVGRKFGLLLANIGGSVAMAIYLLVDYYSASLGYLIGANLIFGMTGGFYVSQCCSYIYIIDSNDLEKRGFRYAIMSGVGLLAISLSTFLIGVIVENYDYSAAITFIFLCYLLAVIYIICLLPESLSKSQRLPESAELPVFYYPEVFENLTTGFRLVNRLRDNYSSRPILRCLGILAILDTFLFACTVEAALLFYIGPPLCQPASIAGYARSVQVLNNVVGPLMGAKVLYRRQPEALGGMLACLSSGIGFIIMGCATSGIVLFIGLFFQFFANFNGEIYRTMILKIVDSDERALAQKALSTLSSVGRLLGTIVTLLLFNGFVLVFSGSIFVIYGVVYFGCIAIYGVVYWFQFLSKEITQPLSYIRPL